MTKPTILIVEDNPTIHKLLLMTLITEGYEVLGAEDGKAALAYMQQTTPDLILQDLELPDMDGFDLNRRLRSLPNGTELPILALSGFLHRMEEMPTGSGWFTASLLKPIEPSYLLEVVASYLPAKIPPVQQIGQGRHILIADDSATQLKLAKMHLKQAGFMVSTAIDGEDTLRQARAFPPDAIISDVLMPRMDGFELCVQVRQDLKLAAIPIFLTSSHYLEESDQILAKQAGATAYIARTPDLKELIVLVLKLLKANTVISKPIPIQTFQEEHIQRLMSQLEHQVTANMRMAQRCALQAAQLSLLEGVAQALPGHYNVDAVLQNVLIACLDVTGISKCLVYLKDNDDKLSLFQLVGYTDKNKKHLVDCFGCPKLLAKVMETLEIIALPSASIASEITKDLLKKADVATALLVPLVSANECFGVLFLGSKTTSITSADTEVFARALGAQIGQTVALATTFERLARSEQQRRLLIDNASCGIIVHTHDWIIQEVNKQAAVLLGCTQNQLIGKNFYDFIPPADREYAAVQLQKLALEKNIGPNEGHIQQLNGTIRDIEFSSTLIEIGNDNLYIAILNDITERKRLRNQALLNDRLASVGTLAAGVAHEVNNPIAWILGNLNFLKEHVTTFEECINALRELSQESKINPKFSHIETLINDPKQQKLLLKFDEIVSESIQGAEQIRDIVRNLKEFTRIDDTNITPVNINEILNATINIAYPEFKYRARLEKVFACDLPNILLPSGKLDQVFLNLIINAAQSIPGNNPQNNYIRITSQLENKRIRIDITDTGIGIAPETLPMIFEPFFTTKPIGSGTGLGLSISHEIINNLGGEIQVHSTPKKGSTFSVVLPLQSAVKIKKKIHTKILPTSTSHARILIVDDEIFLLKSLRRMLEPQHDVTTVLGGRLALELLGKNAYDFDIIISDLIMPDVNGTDLYQFIAKKYPGLEQRLIFMSGGTYFALIAEFIEKISNICLDKPFKLEELNQAIEKCLLKSKNDKDPSP